MTDNQNPSQLYTQTAASHIRNLSTVNEQLPDVVRKAATIISLLTQHPIPPPNTPIAQLSSAESRKDLIQSNTYALYLHINNIRTTLKNQVRDLEKEKVISAEATRFIAAPRIEGQTDEDRERERLKDSESNVINGGLGGLDVGVLNANVRSGRGGGGKDEVLERVERVLDGVKKGAGMETRNRDGDEMAVDG